MKLTAFELVYYFYWKENEMYLGLRLLLYLIPMFILFFVASVLPGIDDFLPVFAEKFLQGKARALFASSYLFAGSFYSSGELVSIETMRS